MERFWPYKLRPLLSLMLAVAVALQTFAYYTPSAQAAAIAIPLPSRKALMVCSLLLSATAVTVNGGGPVAPPLPDFAVSTAGQATLSETRVEQASKVVSAASMVKVTELLGAPDTSASETQQIKFRSEWAKLTAANKVLGTIPSKISFDNWWIQHEQMVFESKSNYPKDMTLQALFMHSATMYVVETYSPNTAVVWMERTRANQALTAASPQSTTWMNTLLTFLKNIAMGALAAGPAGALLLLAIEPKFRIVRVKWQKMWENIWSVIKVKEDPKPKPPKLTLVSNEPEDELTPAQIRREKRLKLSRLQKQRAHKNGMGYTQTTKVLKAQDAAKEINYDDAYEKWQTFYTATQREGRDRVLDLGVFRPGLFADRVAGALERAELNVQGFEHVRRDVMLENPHSVKEIRAVLDELSENIHDFKYYEYRDPEEAAIYSEEIERLKLKLQELGASPEQVARLVKTRTYVYIHKREAVFQLFLHFRHEDAMPEFQQGVHEDIYQESLEVQQGLGLNDFHREFQSEVIAVGNELDYDMGAYADPVNVVRALLDEEQRPIVRDNDKPVNGPVKRPVKR